MTPREAAELIGCSPQHVRTLVRAGKLPATRKPTDCNQHGYRLVITRRDAQRFRDTPRRGPGRPRGSKNKGAKR